MSGDRSDRQRLPEASVAWALVLAFGLNLAVELSTPAASFRHPQRTYVPASLIQRRVDYSTLSGESAPGSSKASPGTSGGSYRQQQSTRTKAGNHTVQAATKDLPAWQRENQAAPVRLRAKAQAFARAGRLDEALTILTNLNHEYPSDRLVAQDLIEDSLSQGKALLQKNSFDRAAQRLRQALYLEPNNSQAANLLAQAIAKSGANPWRSAERLKLADLFALQGSDREATVEYRQAMKIKPSPRALVGLGDLAWRKSRVDEARAKYLEALEMDSGYEPAQRQIGLLEDALGDPIAANRSLSQSLTQNPMDQIAAKALIELWQKQVSFAPNRAESHLGLARAYQLASNLKAAQFEYRQVVRIDPKHPSLPAARESFKQALARQEADSCLQAAKTLESESATWQAYQKVLESLGIYPGNPKARLYQGRLLEQMGDIASAKQAYLTVLTLDPKSVEAARRIHYLSRMPAGATHPVAVINPVNAPPSNAAPLSTGLPGPTANHVTNLANFLQGLRHVSLAEQTQVKSAEKSTRMALRTIGDNASPAITTQLIGQPLPVNPAQLSVGKRLVPPSITEAGSPGGQIFSIPSALSSGIEPSQPSMSPETPPLTRSPEGSSDRILSELQRQEQTPSTAPTAGASAITTSRTTINPVRFELIGLKRTERAVLLNVALKNGSQETLAIPKPTMAVFKSAGINIPVRAKFRAHRIPPHGVIEGHIELPVKQLDPAADLYLPGFLPNSLISRASPGGDVHLSAPAISKK